MARPEESASDTVVLAAYHERDNGPILYIQFSRQSLVVIIKIAFL